MTVPFRAPEQVAAAIPLVRSHLQAGGLLGYPTETVYGLGSPATELGVQRLVQLKGRRPGKPFLLLVSDRAMVQRLGLVLTRAATTLADMFWPGPLTLVLAGAEDRLPDLLRGPEGGIAVRWTAHAGMARLIGALGEPLTSTSANRPGGPTAAGSTMLEQEFREAVTAGTLLVLDGGPLGNVPPSTVVDCTGPVPRLVREGAIPRAELRRRAASHAP
ncbi:MAG: threonylcarbamoyl-AMP synthase [Gemmatimonadetes bacterium RBG_16_66_8]|nr:MAG: threonylcarbamoyl-AMP synthase [Gemmatimonadetes bacterium RBG_16_66_8]